MTNRCRQASQGDTDSKVIGFCAGKCPPALMLRFLNTASLLGGIFRTFIILTAIKVTTRQRICVR